MMLFILKHFWKKTFCKKDAKTEERLIILSETSGLYSNQIFAAVIIYFLSSLGLFICSCFRWICNTSCLSTPLETAWLTEIVLNFQKMLRGET